MSDKNVSTSDVTALFDAERYQQMVADMLGEAKRLGASAAEAAVSLESGLSVTVRLGEVETVEHNRDKGLGITVYFGQRKGSASTSDFGPAAIGETVKAACDIARYTEEDASAGLADAALMAASIPDLQLYHPWAIGAPRRSNGPWPVKLWRGALMRASPTPRGPALPATAGCGFTATVTVLSGPIPVPGTA